MVYDHPRVLFILIDRYTQSSVHATPRRDCRTVSLKNTLNFQGRIYKLSCIIQHMGITLDSGHYIAWVKRNESWYVRNDRLVQMIRSLPDHSGNAYMLFYKKQ